MNKIRTLEQFDALLHEALPLILFSTSKVSKEYVKLLSSFYIAFISNNGMLAKEIEDELDTKMNTAFNNNQYTTHDKKRITHFRNSFLSLEERIRNIEEKVENVDVKKKRKVVVKKEGSVCSSCNIELFGGGKYLVCGKCGRKFDRETLEQVGFRVKCEKCGHTWTYAGKRVRGKCNRCDKCVTDIKDWEIEYDFY